MQIAALSRLIPKCSGPSPAAVSGLLRLVHPNAVRLPATRSYYASRACWAENDLENIETAPEYTAAYHPLSVGNLRNLAPGVPHVFHSRSTSPYFNLAVEHHVLTYSNPLSRILFTYTNTPCVVIGRNQNPWVECDIAAITKGTADDQRVELIRRRSGGGTVFHDEGNLNYTVIVPGDGFERKTHVQMVVDALVALRDKQHVFRRWDQVKANERNDIVARLSDKYRAIGAEEEWFKVSGTAFKLTRGRALHHGTLLHSSPFIDSIGTFLRSPGKDYITAKGVESVRSPVTNLWQANKARQRRDLTFAVTKTIQRMWVEKYAVQSTDQPPPIHVASGHPEELIPELKACIEELRTEAWRWNQTPGFFFDSQDIVTGGRRVRLTFEVKNGLVQSVKTALELQYRYEQMLVGKQIHELSAPGKWREFLTHEEISVGSLEKLVQLVEACFPPLRSKDYMGGPNQPGELKDKDVSPVEAQQIDAKTVKRRSKAGVAEIERQGSNTVVDSKQQDFMRRERRAYGRYRRDVHDLAEAIDPLTARLALWSSLWQRFKIIEEKTAGPAANPRIRLTGIVWLNLMLDDLGAVTRSVTGSLIHIIGITFRLVESIRPVSLPALRGPKVYQPLHARLGDISAEIRDSSVQMTRILTQMLIKELKRPARRSARVGLYDDEEDMYQQQHTGFKPEMSPEEMSNAQRILEATLAMINREDQRSDRTDS